MADYYKCRLCLEESKHFVNIFSEDFSKMIEMLTGLKVIQEDGLPSTSCLQCHQDVKTAMLTRYQIIKSYEILTNELKENLKERENKVELSSNLKNEPDGVKAEEHKNLGQEPLMSEYSGEDDYLLDGISDSEEKPISEIISNQKRQDVDNNYLDKLRSKGAKHKNDNVKFKKKRQNSLNPAKDKVHFKKKSANPLQVKVDYNINPEHQEFLKNLGRKDRVACPICGREMFGMNMKNHLITHNYDPVICDICGKTSKNAQALQDHINYYHKTTPDRFICDKCGKGYRVRFMLQRHERKEHGDGEKKYECTICGKKFFENVHLKNHVKITHNKIKPFKCEYCGKDFGRRTQFVTHQLVHTKESRYHCQVCGKGFKIKQTMQTHLKGVHGIEEEKTVFCNICQKGFSSAQGLRAHINSRVHGLEKCKLCSEYITLEYKEVHLKDVHGIVKTEG